MDEKNNEMPPITSRSSLARRARLFAALALVGFCFYQIYFFHDDHSRTWNIPYGAAKGPDGTAEQTSPPPVGSSPKLVPLEAHIMSKCPDARVSTERNDAILLRTLPASPTGCATRLFFVPLRLQRGRGIKN